MPVYTYSAADSKGRITRERSLESDERTLERELERAGRFLIRIHKSKDGILPQGLQRPIKRQDLIELAYHVSMMSAAGMPLLTGLADFADQRASPRLKKLLQAVIKDISNGMLFSEALSKHSGAFGKIFINLVQAGEASGSLDVVMERFYTEMEWQSRISNRLLQALVYPAILFGALSGLVLLLITYLLPRVMGMFPRGTELALPTRMLVFCSDTLQSYWLAFLCLAVLILLGIKLFRLTERGKYRTDQFLMRLPVVGELFLEIGVARFISTFQTLHRTGVEITRALLIAGESAGNSVIERRARGISEDITAGILLSAAFGKVKEFSSMIKNLMNMSEKTGQATLALERITHYHDTVIPRRVKKMLAVLEPAIIILAGLVVGFVLVGTMYPIFQLYSTI